MTRFGRGLRGVALSCLISVFALCAGCGGGGDTGDSGGGGGAGGSGGGGSPPPVTGSSGIGAAGGTVTEASGAKVVVPAGALTSDIPIAVTQSSAGAPPLPAGVTARGQIYAFTPHGTTFAAPVTITVPFDPASVPPGTEPALYKTNANQTAWEPVKDATVSGNTMVGNVSGFSFATVVSVLAQKSWQADAYTVSGRAVTVTRDTQTGGLVDIQGHLGPDLPVTPPEDPADLFVPFDAPAFWIHSNETGRTFWTQSVAPSENGDPSRIGARANLTQSFYFRVNEDTPLPTLKFVLSKVALQLIDDGGNGPDNRLICRWLPENPTPQQQKDLCVGYMTTADVKFRIVARSFADHGQFFAMGGEIEVNGIAGDWRPLVTGDSVDQALWHSDSFRFDEDVDHDGGRRFLAIQDGAKTIAVPIAHLHKGDIFNVDVTMTATAINHIQGESFVSAFIRDPIEDSGLELETTGLTEIPPRDDIPSTVPTKSCAGGPDPNAGVLQFASSAVTAPEPQDDAAILIERTGGTTGPVSVHIETHDGSAIAGADYRTVSTDVVFGDGQTGQRRVNVPLVDDDAEEDTETVNVTLSSVGGCGTLGARSSATLTILDDDHPLPPPDTHTISGTVTGLTGNGLVLKNVLSGSSVNATNGPFTLPEALLNGSHYDVRVDTQPTNPVQQCTVANGSGVIAGADISNVQVTCISLAQAGGLDPNFGTAGRVVTTIPFSTNVFFSRLGMAMQSDGRILMVGGLTLVRFNADGTLDSTFGTGGQVPVPFTGGGFDGAEDVAVQPDGKIVVVGVTDPGGQFGKDDFAIARFNADGTPDMSFGTGGKTSTDIVGGSTDIARRVRIQPDGKILVAGMAAFNPSPTVAVQEFALVRYNADGTPDATFSLGGSGVVHDSPGRGFNILTGLTLQSDGKIVLAGLTADNGANAPTDVGLIRYLANGTRDDTFGQVGNGTVDSNLQLATSSQADDVLVMPDGTVFVTGESAVAGSTQFVLAAFSSEGRLATGAVLTRFSDQNDRPRSMLRQADGKIVVVGQSANIGVNPDMAIVRYTGSGAAFGPDPSFGTEGKVTIDFFGGRDDAIGVVQQADGKLVVGGLARNGAAPVFALARLLP